MNDDNPPHDEILDIDSGLDDTVVGEITNVEGGRVDTVEADEMSKEDGVTTEVEPSVEVGKVGNKLTVYRMFMFGILFSIVIRRQRRR